MMKKIFLYIITAFLGISLTACDPDKVFEENIELPEYTWDVANKPVFEVNIDDTVSFHDIFVNVRHASHYPYANLYLFITIKSPAGHVIRDTMECVFAEPNGEWKGDGMGDIWDNQMLWKKNVRFPASGKYLFEFEHAMRTQQVPFVMDVGLRVARASKKQP